MSERESPHGLACPNCGGMVPIPEGQVIVRCPNCEMRSIVHGERGLHRYQVPRQIGRERAEDGLRKFLTSSQAIAREAARKAELTEVFTAYLPSWMSWARLLGWVFGEKQVGRGDDRRYEPREIKVAEQMSGNMAACDVGEFGVQEVPDENQPLEPFDSDKLHSTGMVSPPARPSRKAEAIMTNLQPVAPHPETHLLAMGQLAADAFANGQYVDSFCNNYFGNSHYDWNVSRLVLDDEKLVHHWGVWGYPMRLESIQLNVAGIGAVVTHPDYRKQGLMHSAARESFEVQKQAGYDLSILRGRHYVRMGYARAWNYVTYRIKPEELPELGPPLPHRLLSPEQVSEMDAFYNQTHAGFTGTAVRPTYRTRHPDDIGVHAWFDKRGKSARRSCGRL